MPSIYKFIVEAVGMKGTNLYISEKLFGFFHVKDAYDYKVDVDTDTAIMHMASVMKT